MLTPLIEVLWTARYDYQPHWKLERHRHKFFQMIYFLGGAGSFFLDGQEHPISQETLFLIKPHRVHGLAASTAVKTFDVKFTVSDAGLKRWLMEAHDFVVEKDSPIPQLFEKIRREGECKEPWFSELCQTYLLQILFLYLRQSHGTSRHDVPTSAEREALPVNDVVSRRAIKFLKAHYAEDLSLQDLARLLGVSDRHLRQRFRESVGIAPIRYLVNYRVEMAKGLISNSHYALKVVAELVGFKNIHHFSRVFRSATGESPAAWRRRYLDGICKDVCIDPRFSNIILTRPGDEYRGGPSRALHACRATEIRRDLETGSSRAAIT
ncbi:MAG: helix-turn-helix transcriptional regulator [Acidobacteriota bacterium]|nr:helix-turn-helix transcriptional regulator [Acidobacteriota bacterium]